MAKILLVEDEAVLRDAYTAILETTDHDFDVADDGKEALALFAKTKYDLILLDLMMPDMDGVAFLKAANPKKTAPDTKVLAFSNLSSGGDIQEALRSGANRHVLKSDLSPRGVIDLIKETLDS